MSLPAFKYPSDYLNCRKQYVDSLLIQIANNKKNYDAIILKDKTGQLPILPPDYRSIEDKYADAIWIEQQLRAKLGTITDGKNLGNIMNDLLKNPNLMNYIISAFPTIQEYMKKNYSQGVLYPDFMSYTTKKYNDDKLSIGLAKDERIEIFKEAPTQGYFRDLLGEVNTSKKIQNDDKVLLRNTIESIISNMLTDKDIIDLENGTKIMSNLYIDAYKLMPSRDYVVDILDLFYRNTIGNNDIVNLENILLDVEQSLAGKKTPVEQSEYKKMLGEQTQQEQQKSTLINVGKLKSGITTGVLLNKTGLLSQTTAPTTTTKTSPTTTSTTVPTIAQTAPQATPAVQHTAEEAVIYINKDITNVTIFKNFITTNNIKFKTSSGLSKSNVTKEIFDKEKDAILDDLVKKVRTDPSKTYILDTSLVKQASSTSSSMPIGTAVPIYSAGDIYTTTHGIDIILTQDDADTLNGGLPITGKMSGRGLLSSNDALLNKFNILKGEVLAGNNNKTLIKELIQMIHNLAHQGKLNFKEALHSIDELQNLV